MLCGNLWEFVPAQTSSLFALLYAKPKGNQRLAIGSLFSANRNAFYDKTSISIGGRSGHLTWPWVWAVAVCNVQKALTMASILVKVRKTWAGRLRAVRLLLNSLWTAVKEPLADPYLNVCTVKMGSPHNWILAIFSSVQGEYRPYKRYVINVTTEPFSAFLARRT